MSRSLMQGAMALVLFFVVVGPVMAVGDSPLILPAIQKQLNLPENKIDIGIAALTFAKEIYPQIDISDYSTRIDELVEKARFVIQSQGRYDPDSIIRALNTFFYQREGFRYDRSIDAINKIENHYLTGVLDTKQGTCFNLPMLYMAIAQRLGYPVYPVMAPDHVFLRFVSPDLREQNIEATEGGGYSPNEDYIQRLSITRKGLKSGAYLRTLTYRQYLARLLETNAITLGRRGELDRAIRYLEKVVSIDPTSAPTYNSLRIVYIMKSKQAHAAGAFDRVNHYEEKARQAFMKTESLGYIRAQPLVPRGG